MSLRARELSAAIGLTGDEREHACAPLTLAEVLDVLRECEAAYGLTRESSATQFAFLAAYHELCETLRGKEGATMR